MPHVSLYGDLCVARPELDTDVQECQRAGIPLIFNSHPGGARRLLEGGLVLDREGEG